MVRRANQSEPDFEDVLAELTDTAYRTALRHGLRGSFLDTQLALWRDLRAVLESKWGTFLERIQEEERWSTWPNPASATDQGLLVRSR